jgi:alkylation response protein AidB-like acyl-CoA dehydrogenase
VRAVAVPWADGFVTLAREPGPVLHWIERDAAGLRIELESSADGTAMGQLTLDRVGPSRVLAEGPSASKILDQLLDAALVANTAELVGLSDRMLELTLAYLKTRKQFGQPIGSFQALQHRAVDLWLQLRLARAALATAVEKCDDPGSSPAQRAASASSAKARAAHAALQIGKGAVHLHGAIGFTDEYDLGLYANRAIAIAPWLGNAAVHRRRYALSAGFLEL